MLNPNFIAALAIVLLLVAVLATFPLWTNLVGIVSIVIYSSIKD